AAVVVAVVAVEVDAVEVDRNKTSPSSRAIPTNSKRKTSIGALLLVMLTPVLSPRLPQLLTRRAQGKIHRVI
ncbi:MAG: hypothetical protein CMH53_09385, partial [Myxococcales bacterium]|nr:hypothetical protein [Myxococcales bacterium]